MNDILINGKFYAQRVTGVQRFAREMVESMDELLDSAPFAHLRQAMTVVCPTLDAAHAPMLRNIQVQHLPGTGNHRWEQIDLARATRGRTLLNLTGSAPLFKRRQICTIHDVAVFDLPQAYSLPYRLWYKAAFFIQSRLAERILTVSSFSKKRIVERLHLDESEVSVVPNGCDHIDAIDRDDAVLQRLGLEPHTYFLTVGSLHPAKNIDLLLRAYESLSGHTGCRLVVVGTSNAAVFKNIQTSLSTGAAGIVHAGPTSDGELKSLYTHALAFAFPSIYEGFGIPPLEAMRCGCPVAASMSASIPEVCAQAARYFDALNTKAIADALRDLERDASLRSTLIDEGRRQADRYSWRRAATVLLAELAGLGILDTQPVACDAP